MPPVEPTGVGAQQPFHARDQIGLGRFDREMKMIGHQAIRMDFPAGLAASLAKGFQPQLAILVILEDGLAAVAAVHHVVKCARIFNSEFAGHLRMLERSVALVMCKK